MLPVVMFDMNWSNWLFLHNVLLSMIGKIFSIGLDSKSMIIIINVHSICLLHTSFQPFYFGQVSMRAFFMSLIMCRDPN